MSQLEFIAEQIAEVRAQVGDKKVLLALSGGVDSSVVAALFVKAIGKQLVCVHVNHGLLRKGEPEEVVRVFKDEMDANLVYVDAIDRFLDKLQDVEDPETKRKIIFNEFINVFVEEARKLDGVDFLAQGTIYPDILESDGIKAHHNVGGLPEDLNFELVEPVKLLFKDEVRVVGKALGLPESMVERQPFPGPGLGVRCTGAITRDRLEAVRESDAILREEFEKAGFQGKVWQYFTVVPDFKSTGVKDGDGDLAYQTINNCLSDVITTNVIYSEENNILINSYSNFGLDFLVKYDDKGNIIADEKNTYEYDEIGQLVSTIGNNSSSYIYDDRSNILTKIVENEITTFSYSNDGWRDQLTSVNGNALTYDANGNLISYDGKEYNWNYGKCLESITDEESTYNYTYDENGIRTSKTINGVTTNYDTLNGKILAQYNNDSNNHIYFQYYNDTPIGFELNDIQYFYISNINGDIVGITDADGKLLAKYFYDEWGKLSNIETAEENNEEQLSIAEINPLRYRGYYYDSETGMYYIQSRYYDPDLCRFISADDFENLSTNKKQLTNTYLYCFNNPIMYIDYNGEYPQLNEVPPPSSGYKAPKGGPVKQKVPKGSYKGKLGWKDSSGRYWVPDKSDHGGEHWDVVSKDGKSHENIYRDGHNRGDKDDSNNNEGSFLDKAIKLLIKLFVPSENIITVVFSLILIAVFLSTFIWFIPFLIPALA